MTPRIAPPAAIDEDMHELLVSGQSRGGKPLNISMTLARNPAVIKLLKAGGTVFITEGRLPARQREILILRVAWNTRSVYEFGQHAEIGAAAGLTAAEIEQLTCAEPAGFEQRESTLIRMADEICSTNDVTDATWDALATDWSDADLIELVACAGFYRMVAGCLNALRIDLEDGVRGWPVATDPSV